MCQAASTVLTEAYFVIDYDMLFWEHRNSVFSMAECRMPFITTRGIALAPECTLY